MDCEATETGDPWIIGFGMVHKDSAESGWSQLWMKLHSNRIIPQSKAIHLDGDYGNIKAAPVITLACKSAPRRLIGTGPTVQGAQEPGR